MHAFVTTKMEGLFCIISARDWQTISAKSQTVSILNFAGHPIHVTSIQLGCCKVKAVIDSM